MLHRSYYSRCVFILEAEVYRYVYAFYHLIATYSTPVWSALNQLDIIICCVPEFTLTKDIYS